MGKAHKTKLITGSYNYSDKQGVQVQLSLYVFEEGEHTIVYCPALDISGYGSNEDAAQDDFKAVMTEYFRYIIQKKTVREDLTRMGWTVKKSLHKKMTPPTDEEVMKMNESFSELMKTNPIKRLSEPIQIPAFA